MGWGKHLASGQRIGCCTDLYQAFGFPLHLLTISLSALKPVESTWPRLSRTFRNYKLRELRASLWRTVKKKYLLTLQKQERYVSVPSLESLDVRDSRGRACEGARWINRLLHSSAGAQGKLAPDTRCIFLCFHCPVSLQGDKKWMPMKSMQLNCTE